jgi:pseudouridine-5'-monophosphatase
MCALTVLLRSDADFRAPDSPAFAPVSSIWMVSFLILKTSTPTATTLFVNSTGDQTSPGKSNAKCKVVLDQKSVPFYLTKTSQLILSQASEIFHAWAQLPVQRSIFTTQQAALQAQYFPTTRPLPGVPLLLKQLRYSSVHLALATSSHARNFKLKSTFNQGLFTAFPEKNRILGDDPRIPPGCGKPAPDIYLIALETINKELRGKGEREILPSECLVFEDSVPGVEAGRRAGMRVVWCPHPMVLKEYRGREREVLAGVAHGDGDDELDDVMDEVGAIRGGGKGGLGRLDDGWAVLVESLEAFDYGRYGIEV